MDLKRGIDKAAYAQPGVRAGKTVAGISYDVQGSGPVVVLLTGSNLDRRMWARETAWLAKDHTVVRYDLRAHGKSDIATVPFSNLGDLMDVLDTLKIGKAALVGLSAGSTVALDAALEYPTRVERIVLSGPSIGGYVSKQRPAFIADLVAALQARDYTRAADVLLASSVFAAPAESQALETIRGGGVRLPEVTGVQKFTASIGRCRRAPLPSVLARSSHAASR